MPTTSRRSCMGGEECQVRTFAEGKDCLGHHSIRRLPEMAKVIQRDYNYLSKALSPNADETHPLRGDLIVPLTIASAEKPSERNYTLLDWMEQAVGRVAFLMPAFEVLGVDVAGVRHATDAIQAFSQLLDKYSASLADGRVTDTELAEIQAQGRRAIQAMAALMAYAERIAPIMVPVARFADARQR
jgi:hypothetical protein